LTIKRERLFPVPFRFIDGAQKFKKWQSVNARIERAPADRRTESHKLFVDTVRFLGEPLSTARKWDARRGAIDKFRIFDDFSTAGGATNEYRHKIADWEA
jgi:hypothetical protein